MTHLYLFKRCKHIKVIFLMCFGLYSLGTKAQNLVLNPSFESVNNLNCSWYTSAAQFNAAINNWSCPTGGSTDIFNTSLATTCYCSPFSTNGSSVGQQAPRTGNGFVNIVTYGNGGCDPWREYIQGELSAPLVVGQTYEVEMWVSLADNMTVGTNNIGVKFATAPYNQASMCGYYTTPDLNYTGPIIVDKDNWTQIIFCYTPTQPGLQDFIIGNFYNDAATATQAAAGGTGNTIRYFVDDVRIELVTPGGDAGTDGSTTLCATDPSVNLFDYLNGTPDNTGTWMGPSTLTGGYLGTFDPSTATAGTYTYSISGGGACFVGAAGSADVVVMLSNSDATITAAGPFCDTDASVQLSAASTGGTWSGTGITDATLGNFDPSTAGNGTHTITYTITGACGDTQTESIIVEETMDATISAVGPYCISDPSVTLTAVDAGGTWSGNGITDASSGIFDPTTAGIGTHTITYTISGNCGDIKTLDIIVNSGYDATISVAGPFCDADASTQLAAASAGGTWSGTGITDATLGTFDPSTAGLGTHTITYTISGACGDTQTENIIVEETMDATISAVGPFCVGDPAITLTAVDAGGTWSGTGITDAALGTFDPSTAGLGTHTITYTVSGNCGDTKTIDIIINTGSDATITAVGPFCDSDATIQLTSATTGGTWSGTGITDATLGIFDPVTATEGVHTITYTMNGNCPIVETTTITVNGSPILNSLTDQNICANNDLTVQPFIVTPANALVVWNNTGTDLGFGLNGTGNIGTFTSVNNGTTNLASQIDVTPTSTEGCVGQTESFNVTINPTPVVTFDATPLIGCEPLVVNFTNTTLVQGQNCIWDFGDGNSSMNCGNVINTYNEGLYDVSLTVTSTEGCTDQDTYSSYINVSTQPIANFSCSQLISNITDREIEFTNTSTAADSYLWDFGDNSATTSISSPNHTFPEIAGSYLVTLWAYGNSTECIDSTQQQIIIEDVLLFYVPNTFTPDGDQFNETFQPVFTTGFDPYDYHLLIFDRWGEIIFESFDASAGWNGHYGNGTKVQDGVYVWKIEFKEIGSDKRHQHIGHINLLK